MSVKAKLILKDKFWILTDKNKKIGTLSKDNEFFTYQSKSGTKIFQSKKSLTSAFGNIIWLNKENTDKKQSNTTIHGFLTNSKPHNVMYDVKLKLPLYTKTSSSKIKFCAGYYILKFPKGWVKSFCPKLSTLNQTTYKGPFKTFDETMEQLNIARRN